MDTNSIPLYENNRNDGQLSKSIINTGGNITNDTLTIQHNERIMNHKKKDSNSHLNKFNSAVNYLEKTSINNKESNYNSAKKYGNSPKELQEKNKMQNNNNLSYNKNENNNNYENSIKPKRQYENFIQTINPYSGVNTDNSDNLIKSNTNKHSDYNSNKVETNNNNNFDYLSSGARFYDPKSKLKNLIS